MNYSVKSVIIICFAAIASFFIAQAIIPDKKTEKSAYEQPRTAQKPADGEIPVVMADGVPLEDPLLSPKTQEIPRLRELETRVSTERLPKIELEPNTRTSAAQETKTKPESAAQPPAPTPAPIPAAPRPAAATASNLRIEKAAVCASIVNKMPDGISDRFSKDLRGIYYFTHVTGAHDTTAVVHRWYRNEQLIQTSVLHVKSPSWRTHSRRNLAGAPEMAGNWRVEVTERGTGRVLGTASFVVE
ncbi:MAG: DUF2914 domain-containing protein [Chitinispirillales bacterium]|jgi:hypothetical protein|nr:DUF2914 domain-containing protein [Chitinispirillales bacterium]